MSRVLFAIAFLLIPFCRGWAQVFPVDTLFKNGGLHDRINLVFMGDGYQDFELNKFRNDAYQLLDRIFSQTPFKEYKNYFNAFAIMVPSSESGATHPQLFKDTDLNCAQTPIANVNTYFGSSFDTFGVHHLLVPSSLALVNVLSESFPFYDQVLLIVNTEWYGGSGGGVVATIPLSVEAGWVSLHEIGHSFGELADEYWPGPAYAIEKPNLTQESDPAKIRWKNWLNTNGVGIYLIPGSTGGWYRPHQNCMMQVPGFDFCSVCSEAIIERIHTLTTPVLTVDPPGGSLLELGTEDVELKLTTIEPMPNTLRIVWRINNKIIGKNTPTITIPLEQLNDGYFKLIKAEVIDTTHLTRSETHSTGHLYLYQWVVDGLVTAVENEKIKFEVTTWPNPTHGNLNVSFDLEKQTEVDIRILDENGKALTKTGTRTYLAGKHNLEYTIDKQGILFVVMTFNGALVTSKIVRQ